MFLNKQNIILDFTKYFEPNNFPKKIAVAVSGGCDSLALTLLLKEFSKINNIQLLAITIDHKMRQNSSLEAKEVAKILSKEEVFHQILEIKNNEVFDKNIEANMRKYRYDLLYEFCQKNEVNHLFLGHHINDVAENFLIRLFRGSGLDGLSTMKESSEFKKIKLIRPLLNITKSELKNYLLQKNISWIEDESNKDEKFLRNKIRNFLESFEESDLIAKRIKNSTDEISEIRDYFDDLMLEYAQEILEFSMNENPRFLINLDKLKKINEKYALKILSLIFMEISQRNYKPRLKELKIFYYYLLQNQKIKPRNFYGCSVNQVDEKKIAIVKNLTIEANEKKQDFYFRTKLGLIFK